LTLLRRLILLGVVVLATLLAYLWLGLPGRGEVRALAKSNPGLTGVMRQREKEAQAAGRTPRRQQTWVPLSRVSRHLVHAVLSSEDQNFFGHQGVDWDAIEKSVQEDRKQWRLARGGSTITQQLAKNLFFTTHKSPVRKLRELLVAHWLEEDLGKRRILELYLNVIEWGPGVYGIGEASRQYFDKTPSGLTLGESALLAVTLPNPVHWNPKRAPQFALRRQQELLSRLRRENAIADLPASEAGGRE
jgi:monofunctional glycosyltransferase